MSRKVYGPEEAGDAYRTDLCPACGKERAKSGSLENDDGINFWTVGTCEGCGAEITVVLELVPRAVVALTGEDIEQGEG